MGRVDGTLAVDGLAQGVHHTAQHGVADGDVHDAAGRAALVALLDGVHVAKEDGADGILVEVLRQAKDGAARTRAGELQQLAGHRGLEARDAGDTVAHLCDHGGLVEVHRGTDVLQLVAQDAHDVAGLNTVTHRFQLR